jgi:phosphate-selective porin OprO/OprP
MRIAYSAILGLAILPGMMAAQEGVPPPTADMKTVLDRLDRLEQENRQLREDLEEQKKLTRQAANPPATDEESVHHLVKDYLDERDQQRRQEEARQKQEAESQGYEVGSDVSMKSAWRDGMLSETSQKDFRAHFGGRIQADAGWFAPDQDLQEAFPDRWQDGADFRRLRFRADGTAYEVIDFVLEMEFSQGINGLTTHPFPTDAFLDFKYLPWIGNLAVGHYKEPFSLEDYGTPDSYGVFMERSGADSAFTPDRNLGIMMHDSYWDERVIVATGVFRSNSDARSGNAFDYGDGEYASTSRLAFVPWYESDGRCWLLVGGAYSHRSLNPNDAGSPGLPANANPSRGRFAVRAPLRINSPTFLDVGGLVADSVDLYNLQAALNLGPFLLQGEYYWAQVNDAQRGLLAVGEPRYTNPGFDGFYVQASYFLTGEYHPLDRKWGRLARVRPNEQWFLVRRGEPGKYEGFAHGRGAWEIAARYGYVNLNSPVLGEFPGVPGVPDSGVARVATAGNEQDVTLSLSVYLNPNTRIQGNYVYAFRGVVDEAGRGDVSMFGLRLWWDF